MARRLAAAFGAIILLTAGAGEKPVFTSEGWKEKVEPYCKGVVAHKPRADVIYTPDESTDSWAVASPYVNEPYHVDLSTIKIPVKIPLKKYIANPDAYNVPLDEMFIEVGDITIVDGQLHMNGQPLDKTGDEIEALCAMAKEESKKD